MSDDEPDRCSLQREERPCRKAMFDAQLHLPIEAFAVQLQMAIYLIAMIASVQSLEWTRDLRVGVLIASIHDPFVVASSLVLLSLMPVLALVLQWHRNPLSDKRFACFVHADASLHASRKSRSKERMSMLQSKVSTSIDPEDWRFAMSHHLLEPTIAERAASRYAIKRAAMKNNARRMSVLLQPQSDSSDLINAPFSILLRSISRRSAISSSSATVQLVGPM